jgi:hypothetical protein
MKRIWIPNDDDPTKVGWYAVTRCWDLEEGIFPDAHFWDGRTWDPNYPIGERSPMAFDSKKEALDWGYEHDPEL